MLDTASVLRLILFILQRGRLIKILKQCAFPKEHLPSHLGQIRTESNVPGGQSLLANKLKDTPIQARESGWITQGYSADSTGILFPIPFVALQITVSLTKESERPRLGIWDRHPTVRGLHPPSIPSGVVEPLTTALSVWELSWILCVACKEQTVFSAYASESRSNRRHSSGKLLIVQKSNRNYK